MGLRVMEANHQKGPKVLEQWVFSSAASMEEGIAGTVERDENRQPRAVLVALVEEDSKAMEVKG